LETYHFRVEVDPSDDTNMLVTPFTAPVRFPIKKRVHLDPDCLHRYWLHECTCLSVLGKHIEERFENDTHKGRLKELEAITQDLRLILAEHKFEKARKITGSVSAKKKAKVAQLEKLAKLEKVHCA
jgi:hypothetical protein